MRWCNIHACYDKFCCAALSPQQLAERVPVHRPGKPNDRINVTADIRDEEDHADAAYNLCMENVTPAEFCEELLATLQSDWGLTHQAGKATLTVTITRTETAK